MLFNTVAMFFKAVEPYSSRKSPIVRSMRILPFLGMTKINLNKFVIEMYIILPYQETTQN
jgi:hypothetical protein